LCHRIISGARRIWGAKTWEKLKPRLQKVESLNYYLRECFLYAIESSLMVPSLMAIWFANRAK
jgi:hypothetical protein